MHSEVLPILQAEIIEDDLKEHGIVKMEVEGEIDTITYIDQYESCVQCNSKVESLDSMHQMWHNDETQQMPTVPHC